MTDAPTVDVLLEELLRATRSNDAPTRDLILSDLAEHEPARVAVQLARMMERSLESAWDRGWQPADLMRVTGKDLGKPQVEVLRRALSSQARGYERRGRAVAPEWMAQLETVGAAPGGDVASPWPLQIAPFLSQTVRESMELLVLLGHLPRIPRLTPHPSRWADLPGDGREIAHLEPGILARIRALLAKAESSDFDAEAEAFTAKAQEMMTRYRIDRAALGGDGVSPGGALGRRVGVESPYARAKALLVGGIARANSCRAVWSQAFGFATVFGFPEDLDAVEELYTSLLVQATSALRREGPKVDRFGRSRTARFRRSFLLGFAARISERLQEATLDTVRAVTQETGRDLVPMLDRREQAAEDAMRAAHSRLRDMSVSISDGEGYRAGVGVADRADLGGRPGQLPSPVTRG